MSQLHRRAGFTARACVCGKALGHQGLCAPCSTCDHPHSEHLDAFGEPAPEGCLWGWGLDTEDGACFCPEYMA